MLPKSRFFKKLTAVGALSLTAGAASAVPVVLDLESVPPGSTLSAGVGVFRHVDKEQHSNPEAFLTTQDDHGSLPGVVDAFNGSAADAGNPDAIFGGDKTHPIQVGDLFTTTDGAYYVFLFDANQEQHEDHDHVDFSSLKIFVSSNGGLLSISELASQTLLYDMDATMDYTLRVDGRVGMGGADMYFYLPTSLAWGADTNYVYLYTAYTGQNDGPDAWNLARGEYTNPPQPVPEPGTLALVALGLAGFAASRRRRQ